MSSGYSKLWGSILTSTVWQEPLHVKIAWITMLALTDAGGYVGASVPGLAHQAGITIAQCEEALAVFLAPDPYSRTREHEGRRIEERDGGWFLLNYEKHRVGDDAEARREANREAVRRHRERKVNERREKSEAAAKRRAESNEGPSGLPPEGAIGNITVTETKKSNAPSLQAEAEAEAEALTTTTHHHHPEAGQTDEPQPVPAIPIDLIAVLPSDDLPFLAILLERVRYPEAWIAELRVALKGMHHKPITGPQLGSAIRQYMGNGAGENPNMKHFSAYIGREARGGAKGKKGGGKGKLEKGRDNLAAFLANDEATPDDN